MPPLNLPTRLTALPKMALLVLAALALPGCFHSDDDPAPAPTPTPTPDANPVGYYSNNGFVDVKAGDNTTQRLIQKMQGMVHGGQLLMLNEEENLTYVGTFTVSGNDINGTVTIYEEDVMTQQNVPLSGMITQGSKITGTLSGTGAANGTFQLNYAADNGPVDMSMVIRELAWEPVTGVPPTIPFLGVGDDLLPFLNFGSVVSGNGIFNSCDFNGRIEPIADTHLYTVLVTVTSCMTGDIVETPTYTGLVSVRSDVNANDRLILVLTNGAYDFSGEYRAR